MIPKSDGSRPEGYKIQLGVSASQCDDRVMKTYAGRRARLF
jgi:hypothetical protein